MYAALGIVTASYQRGRTGRGQLVDISMFDSLLSWLGYFPHHYWHYDDPEEAVARWPERGELIAQRIRRTTDELSCRGCTPTAPARFTRLRPEWSATSSSRGFTGPYGR